MKVKVPDTNSMDYKYGIFAKIEGTGSRHWTDSQIKYWMNSNDIGYEELDKREDLVKKIKRAGYK